MTEPGAETGILTGIFQGAAARAVGIALRVASLAKVVTGTLAAPAAAATCLASFLKLFLRLESADLPSTAVSSVALLPLVAAEEEALTLALALALATLLSSSVYAVVLEGLRERPLEDDFERVATVAAFWVMTDAVEPPADLLRAAPAGVGARCELCVPRRLEGAMVAASVTLCA
jgi:hypothetical protein